MVVYLDPPSLFRPDLDVVVASATTRPNTLHEAYLQT